MKPTERVGPSKPGVKAPPGHETDETDLIARCRAGDAAAYRILVDRHRDRAYGLALRIVRSAPDAEEVAQDAFVRAWLGMRDYRGDAAFGTWLYRIVARRALDRAAILKGRRTREESLGQSEVASAAVAPAGASAASAAPGRDSRRIAQVMDALSDAQRGVVMLFYFEERPVSEIARILNIPDGTVKTHLSRARATLRREWLRRARVERWNEL
jgi:RNA polymerase sigma-70 factor, ECF subfamily